MAEVTLLSVPNLFTLLRLGSSGVLHLIQKLKLFLQVFKTPKPSILDCTEEKSSP